MMVQSGKSISFIFVLLERFAWSCEITFHNSLICCSQHPFCFISHDYAKISHGHAKSRNMLFPNLLCNFSHFFMFNPSPPPSIKLQSLVQVHFLFLFLFIHIMYPPPFHFPFVTPCFKNHLKISPKLNKEPLESLARVVMYYLSILGIITTQKVWNSWKLVSKICGFWVVIRYFMDFFFINVVFWVKALPSRH